MDSYRIESLGLLAALTAVEHLFRFHHIQNGKICIACDNDASLMKCIENDRRSKPTDKYFDVFWATKDIRSRIKVELTAKQVKGHQDKHKKRRQLSRIEKLNCYVDDEAKKYRMWLEHTESYHPPKLFGDKNWSLWIKGEKVTKDVRKKNYRTHPRNSSKETHQQNRQHTIRDSREHRLG